MPNWKHISSITILHMKYTNLHLSPSFNYLHLPQKSQLTRCGSFKWPEQVKTSNSEILSKRKRSPVVDICLLLFIDSWHPAHNVDVAHFLTSDGLLFQYDIHSVPDDDAQNISATLQLHDKNTTVFTNLSVYGHRSITNITPWW